MSRYKVKDTELKELADLYNTTGKQAVYKVIRTRFNVKNPTCVFKRMCENPDLSYNSEKDCFETGVLKNTKNVFMSMEELCSPIIPQHANTKEQEEIDNRSAAMDKLIRELIGDRLLELNKYVTIDSLSKRIIVDKTTLIQDGYQLFTH
ncbi:MAG: hypothetical protein ACERKN_19155 [Velocimicrobium sp.]